MDRCVSTARAKMMARRELKGEETKEKRNKTLPLGWQTSRAIMGYWGTHCSLARSHTCTHTYQNTHAETNSSWPGTTNWGRSIYVL